MQDAWADSRSDYVFVRKFAIDSHFLRGCMAGHLYIPCRKMVCCPQNIMHQEFLALNFLILKTSKYEQFLIVAIGFTRHIIKRLINCS